MPCEEIDKIGGEDKKQRTLVFDLCESITSSFLKSLFIYFERERDSERERGRERGRERESQAGSTLSGQSPTQGLTS